MRRSSRCNCCRPAPSSLPMRSPTGAAPPMRRRCSAVRRTCSIPIFWRDVDRGGARLRERARAARPGLDQLCARQGRRGAHGVRPRLALAGLCVFAFGLVALVAPALRRARASAARYGNALAALLVFARRALTTPLAVFVVLELLDQFELVPPSFERLATEPGRRHRDRGAGARGGDQRAGAGRTRRAGSSRSTMRPRSGCPRT